MGIAKLLGNNPFFKQINRLEDELAAAPDTLKAGPGSGVRFDIMAETMKRRKGGPPLRMIPIMVPIIFGVRKSLRDIKNNPPEPKTEAPPELFAEIEKFVFKQGVASIGYTKVPADAVFQNKAVCFENAIVLSMEMDKAGISSAPSIACETTVMEIYRDLGRVAIKLAAWLRKAGYGAQAGHALNGQALYPRLAEAAGMGRLGLNGLTITPEFGPRVRLAAVYTSITNLPFFEGPNEHEWVSDFCNHCHACIKHCPAEALYEKPLRFASGQVTHVDNEKCFPYFSDNYGCSVCIKECPFHKQDYEVLHETFLKHISHYKEA